MALFEYCEIAEIRVSFKSGIIQSFKDRDLTIEIPRFADRDYEIMRFRDRDRDYGI